MSAPISAVLAAVCLLAFLALVYRVCGTTSGGPQTSVRRFWYIFLGSDDRVSTSKVQFGLWTLALAYALLVIIFHDFVYPAEKLDPRYLLLLGFPAGAAVGAKAITTTRVANKTITKPSSSSPRKSPGDVLREIVANDDGDLDLGDAQYFIFNLVALTAFIFAFAHHPATLPVLPDTLVGLTSASATAYLAKKAVQQSPQPAERPAPKLTAVSPQRGHRLTEVFGSGLADYVDVTIGGLRAASLDPEPPERHDTVIRAVVPADLQPGLMDVQVVVSDGQAATLPAAFQVV